MLSICFQASPCCGFCRYIFRISKKRKWAQNGHHMAIGQMQWVPNHLNWLLYFAFSQAHTKMNIQWCCLFPLKNHCRLYNQWANVEYALKACILHHFRPKTMIWQFDFGTNCTDLTNDVVISYYHFKWTTI